MNLWILKSAFPTQNDDVAAVWLLNRTDRLRNAGPKLAKTAGGPG